MTLADFLSSLETELRFRGEPFDRGALVAFAEGVYPLAEDDGDVARWAGEFLEALPAVDSSVRPGHFLGFCRFVDGVRLPIYADGDRQFTYSLDGERVYGDFLVPGDDCCVVPVVV